MEIGGVRYNQNCHNQYHKNPYPLKINLTRLFAFLQTNAFTILYDCLPHEKWIRVLYLFSVLKNCALITGPIIFKSEEYD
jgi:hypothetical protein